MMWSKKVVILLTITLLAVPAMLPNVAAEDPHNRDCAGVVVALVCAGADAGANVDCTNLSQTEVTCDHTYGWNLAAYSPAQLPGSGDLAWDFTVETCISGVGCSTTDSGSDQASCTWVAADDTCRAQSLTSGDQSFTLELGQCVTVTATVTVSAEAWSPDRSSGFTAHAAQETVNSGAACALDNGR